MIPGEGLSPVQLDTLKELINIGFGKASVALSSLTDCRIILKVPEVWVLPSSEIDQTLQGMAETAQTYFTVGQTFSGPISGTALLFIPRSRTAALSQGYKPEDWLQDRLGLQGFLEDAVIETGNVVLESFAGTLANILDCRIFFQAPQLLDLASEALVPSAWSVSIKPTKGLFCRTSFAFGQAEVQGHLLGVLSDSSLAWLCSALDGYLEHLG